MWQALIKKVLMGKIGDKGGGMMGQAMGQQQPEQPSQSQPTQQSQWAPLAGVNSPVGGSQFNTGNSFDAYLSKWAPLNYYGTYGRR